MMQSLYIITELFPPDETSTAYILGEIANVCTREYKVNVICGPEVYDKRKTIDTEHPFNLNPAVTVYRVKDIDVDKNKTIGKSFSFIVMSWRLYRQSKKLVTQGDKVLLVTNPAPLVVLISHMRKYIDFELNLLVHDVFPENTIPAGLKLPKLMYNLLKRYFDKAYSRVDKFFTLGRDMAEVVHGKASNKDNICIVENWADVDIITPQPMPEGKIIVEYAGNIGRVQGLDKLVTELPKGVELHFYGTGAMENSLKSMEKPNVVFHGPYFRSQQSEVLTSCHVAIVTLSENMYGLGVPSKTYNIMAAGRPIIYFGPENGEIALMIKEYNIGYIGWPEKWDIKELEDMGLRARKLAESTYSKDFILNKFLFEIR